MASRTVVASTSQNWLHNSTWLRHLHNHMNIDEGLSWFTRVRFWLLTCELQFYVSSLFCVLPTTVGALCLLGCLPFCSWKLCQLLQLALSCELAVTCSSEPFAIYGTNGIQCGRSDVLRRSPTYLHMLVAGSPPVLSDLAWLSLAQLSFTWLSLASLSLAKPSETLRK